MLRGLVLLLVLANGGFYLWSQGHLAGYGLAPQTQREPERLQQQVTPEVMRLVGTPGPAAQAAPTEPATTPAPAPEAPGAETPAASAAAPAAAPAIAPAAAPAALLPAQVSETPALASTTALPAAGPASPAPTSSPAPSPAPVASGNRTPAAATNTASAEPAAPRPQGRNAALQVRACMQASGFTAAEAAALRTSLAQLDLAPGTWQLRETRSAGRWLVYLGRFDNTAQLERKQTELRELQVEARSVSTPGLAPGLSLGSYPTEDAARQALQGALRSGVRTARVALERAESVSVSLRLPSALPIERSAVADLGDALAGKTLEACN